LITEPLEAIIALLLISIILYSVFVYSQRGTENIVLMRTLTRSIAGTVAGMYANYTNSSISFYEFNSTVNEFLEYVEKKENVSIAANITVVLKDGNLRTAKLRQMSRPVKRSITENITLFLANESRELHVYALPYWKYVYLNTPNVYIYVYVVGYYSDGTPTMSMSVSAQADDQQCLSFFNSQYIHDGITLLIFKTNRSSCSNTVNITIHYNIDGKRGKIVVPLSVKQGSSRSNWPEGLENERQCDNKPCYLYFLGETINLTNGVSNWRIQSRRGLCPTSGSNSGDITTASGVCDSLPRYIFFTPGPYNLSMNNDDTHQPFFIEPYFTIISVRVGFNR